MLQIIGFRADFARWSWLGFWACILFLLQSWKETYEEKEKEKI